MLYTCAAEFDFISLTTIYRLSSTLLLPIVYAVVGCIALYATGFGEKKTNDEPCQKRPPASLSIKKQRESRREMKEVVKPTKSHRQVDAAVQYNILQLVAFIIMAAMIMRLKLFMSPHLCIVASLVASKKVNCIFFISQHSKLMIMTFVCSTCSSLRASWCTGLYLLPYWVEWVLPAGVT